jgi:alpha-glucosidase
MMTYSWWQTGIIYQVYPRSFQDSDGDGIGDLNGINQRLDYLKALGVTAIWVSPIFPSPMRDFGYDITDYCAIDRRFGAMADFDALLSAAHAAGLKLILDFVPNHTSDQHPWFAESRASRTSPKRDWYIWRDPGTHGSLPNNWESEFGGPAWTFDPPSGQYYYHAYLKEQPDLNWRNREVQQAMCDVLRFWFARGVDGFRVDAIHHLLEDVAFRDNPPDPNWRHGMPPAERWFQIRTIDQPEVHDAIRMMRSVAEEFGGKVMIGEAYLPIDRLMAYYGVDLSGFHLPFNFHLISAAWNPPVLAALIEDYERALPAGAWPNWVLGNHDRSRVASRIGSAQARVAAMLLLTLRGTPTIYQGEELGMTDVPIPPALVQDPFERNVPGLGLGRDPVRTPMPWSGARHGGFTTGTPWLPLGPCIEWLNANAQAADPTSMLALYRALLRLRNGNEVLSLGGFRIHRVGDSVLAYERHLNGRRLLVALNMTDRSQAVGLGGTVREAVLSTYLDGLVDRKTDWVTLRPNEGLILELEAGAARDGAP